MPATGAFVLRNPILTIGGTSYTGQITKARLVPSVETQQLKTLDPAVVYSDVDTPSWVLELTGVQGWKNAEGICDYLNDNAGVSVAAVLQPKPGSGEKTAAFNFIAHAVEFGGEQGDWAVFEAEFPVVNVPVFTDAV